MFVLAERIDEIGEGDFVLQSELCGPVIRIYSFFNEMGGSIPLEDDSKCGVVGLREWGLSHPRNQAPSEIEFEELAQDVYGAIVGVWGVLESVFGFDPVEEIECAFPVVGVSGDGLMNGFGVEVRGGIVGFLGEMGRRKEGIGIGTGASVEIEKGFEMRQEKGRRLDEIGAAM